MVTVSNSSFSTNFFVYTTNTETIPVTLDYTRTVAKAPVIYLEGENNLLDTSSNGNVHDGVILDAGLTYAAGVKGNAISMDGTNTSFSIPHDSELAGSFSLSYWLKWPGATTNMMIALAKGAPWDPNGGFQFTINNWSGWKYVFWGRTNAATFNQTLGNISASVFNHIGLTYDKSEQVYQAYFNGTLLLTISNVTDNNTGDLMFGKRTGSDFGNAVIDNFKFYDIPFAPGQMKWLYENDLSNIITNNLPYVDSVAPFAYPAAFYSYVISADDPDMDPVIIDVVSLPAWMSFDSNTYTISGTPSAGDLGTNWISVELDDGKNEIITNQHFIIVESNNLPYVSSTPPAPAYPGDVYGYGVTFGDADADPVSAVLISAPSWVMFELASNFIHGNPAYGAVGSNAVVLQLYDGKNYITNTHYLLIEYNPGGRAYTPPIIKLEFENNLLDTSSNGNVHDAFVETAGSSYVSGASGNGIKFDGTSSVAVSHDSELTGDFTLTYWVNRQGGMTVSEGVIGKGSPFGSDTGFQLSAEDWGGWKWALYSTGGSRSFSLIDTNSSAFIQVAMVYDDSLHVAEMYVDGIHQETISNASNISSSDLLIGRRNGTKYFSGIIDNLKYYNTTFAAPVILELYSNDFSDIEEYPPQLVSAPSMGYSNTLYSYQLDI
jgi:hypothetical protein